MQKIFIFNDLHYSIYKSKQINNNAKLHKAKCNKLWKHSQYSNVNNERNTPLVDFFGRFLFWNDEQKKLQSSLKLHSILCALNVRLKLVSPKRNCFRKFR